MTRKVWILIGVAVVLAAGSLYLNKDWFAKENIHIYDRSRPVSASRMRPRSVDPAQAAICPIVFGFGERLKLTRVKVVPLTAIETNKYPQPIWHMVSDSNSLPIKAFTYGQRIPGMRPDIKGSAPAPLQPGSKYRLFIESGSQKAQHDFVPLPAVP